MIFLEVVDFTLLFYYMLRECNFEFPIIPLSLCTYLHVSLRVLTVIISDWKCRRLCSGGGISISDKNTSLWFYNVKNTVFWSSFTSKRKKEKVEKRASQDSKSVWSSCITFRIGNVFSIPDSQHKGLFGKFHLTKQYRIKIWYKICIRIKIIHFISFQSKKKEKKKNFHLILTWQIVVVGERITTRPKV